MKEAQTEKGDWQGELSHLTLGASQLPVVATSRYLAAKFSQREDDSEKSCTKTKHLYVC